MTKSVKKLRNRRRRIILATKRKAPTNSIEHLLKDKILVVPATTTLH